MASSLPRRIAVAAVGIPLAIGMIYLGSWVLVGGLVLLGVVGTRELFALVARAGVRPLTVPGYVAAALFPVTAYLLLTGSWTPQWVLFGAAAWLIGTMSYAVRFSSPGDQPILALGATIFGPCYAAGLLAFLVLIRHGVDDASALTATVLVFLPLVTTWLCDTFAMTGGSLFGGPKFAPVVSPNKTWSGTLSGLVGAGAVAVAYGAFVLTAAGIALGVWQLLAIGLVVGVLGQIGDLAESLLKRSVGVKDSGSFFPGHGGVLDRLDSLYWVIPMSAMCFYAFGVL
jgi:phosphatidate cytidylyltransferase